VNMSPGVIEEVGKVATSTIDSLKSNPTTLALVLLQVVTLAAILYSNLNRQAAFSRQMEQVTALLEKCQAGLMRPQAQYEVRRSGPTYRLQSDDDKPADLDHEFIGPPVPGKQR